MTLPGTGCATSALRPITRPIRRNLFPRFSTSCGDLTTPRTYRTSSTSRNLWHPRLRTSSSACGPTARPMIAVAARASDCGPASRSASAKPVVRRCWGGCAMCPVEGPACSWEEICPLIIRSCCEFRPAIEAWSVFAGELCTAPRSARFSALESSSSTKAGKQITPSRDWPVNFRRWKSTCDVSGRR